MFKKISLLLAAVLLVGVIFLSGCSDDEEHAVPVSGPAIENAAEARDAAIDYIRTVDEANAPGTDSAWREKDGTPDQLVGGSTKVFESEDWTITVSYPVVAPENTRYRITINGGMSGWYWKGTVDAEGAVTEDVAFSQLTEERSREIAEAYLKASPTYLFDGMEETLKYTETMTLKCPYCWSFIFEFESRHAGYGDRSDMMTAQVITPHEAVITVVQGNVTSAIMDSTWDMVNQEEISTGQKTIDSIDYACVGTLLDNPAYEMPISVTGQVSLLGELLCPCFELSSCDASIQVWYGLMVENDGTEIADVDMEGIENGDTVFITGVLKGTGGTHYAEGDFWLESIEKID